MAINKFLHTVISSYVLASIFVVGVSAWFLLKNKDVIMAKRSMVVAIVFGLISSIVTIWSGDDSARQVAEHQPMKLAAMEGLYKGDRQAPLIAFGVFGEREQEGPHKREQFIVNFEIPKALSYLAFLEGDAFVPGIDDLVHGNEKEGIPSYEERINSGKIAIDALANYKKEKKAGNLLEANAQLELFETHFKDFGYGFYYGHNPHELIPNVKLSFYSFHIMVVLGTWFLVLFILLFYHIKKGTLQQKRWLLWASLFTIPLAYLASQSGWVVAEVGRQPWTIQNLMPNIAAVSQIKVQSVQTTFFLFLIIFTALLIAEVKIMLSAIKKGVAH
jgi:cytochrome d ubiquinol oxidase subunit I